MAKPRAGGPRKASMDRASRGRTRDGALFPARPREALPADYARTLHAIKRRVEEGRIRAVVAANVALVQLYWDIGQEIRSRQAGEGWGSKVVDRLAEDLRKAFPDMKGFSSRNLNGMRAFAQAYPDGPILQQPVAKLPWGHVMRLLERVKDAPTRDWYATRCAAQGWSRSILELQISGRAHEREGKALSNFERTLPPADSDMAGQIFKDPYLFDFLGTADARREAEVEQSLMEHLQQFLLELGTGFAFVGRQVPLEVGGEDFSIDLLFYHLKLRCYVVIELKAVPFDAAFVGELNLYLSAVDDLLKHPEDKPTIGLLLCRSKNKVIVEYALRDLKKPIGVAQWETKLLETLPEDLHASLPTVEELEAELTTTISRSRVRTTRRSR